MGNGGVQIKSWFRSFLNRWFVYLFPLFLIIVEIILRNAFQSSDATLFIGPSLAAAGAAFIAPLTAKKPMTTEKLEKIKKDTAQAPVPQAPVPQVSIADELLRMHKQGYAIMPPVEDALRNFCIGFAFFAIALWLWALWLAFKPSQISLWFVPLALVPGLLNYAVGFVLTEIGEGIY